MLKFISYVSDDEVAAIGRGLMDRTLPKSAWTHAAHFTATLWVIACRDDLDAERDIPTFIRAYNESLGNSNTDTSGYHETITLASMRGARAFLNARPEEPLFIVCNALMASPLGKSDWPLTYWSREQLFSVRARRAWLEPNLRPLPF